MNLGVAGGGTDIEALVAAASARGDRIVRVADPGDRESIDRLLDAAVCDVVAVGAEGWPAEPPDLRADTVRLLVQAGRPLVLSQPLEPTMLWAYEIDMIRRESGAVVVPWLPARLHPAVARLKAAVEQGVAGGGPLGALESVRLERTMPLRTRETVLDALARDVDLVRLLVGEPARLATLGGADPESAWGTLEVGFSGPDLLPARWQVTPGGPPALTITLQHAAGSVRVEAPDVGPWRWSGPPPATVPFDAGAAMLAVVDRAVGDGTIPSAIGSTTVPPATWSDAARAIELAETVPRSLAKGRAVDLHREEFSELGTFRGTMASLGCGIVLLALVVLLVATLVGGIAREFGWEFGKRLAEAWPGVILAVLTLFLLLQLVPLLVGDDRGRRAARVGGAGPANDAAGPRRDERSGSPG
jgi:predicted dehydrogenase